MKFWQAASLGFTLSWALVTPAWAAVEKDPLLEDMLHNELAVDEAKQQPAKPKKEDTIVEMPSEPVAEPAPLPEDPAIDPTKTHYIQHPQSKKGLMRISKEGEYFYRIKSKSSSRAAGFTVGALTPPDIKNPATSTTYKDVYGQGSTLAVLANFEKQVGRSFGRLGFKFSTGIVTATGNGRLTLTQQQSRERFTLILLPNNAGLVYRFHFWRRQLIVPFAEGGGDYFTFMETRNDGKQPKYAAAPAAHMAGGAAFALNFLDRLNASRMDQEYGINRVYFTVEYRRIVGLSSKFDFSSNLVSGGFLFDF